jgi:hypothetical protein
MNDRALRGAPSGRTADTRNARVPSLTDQDNVPGRSQEDSLPDGEVAEVVLLLPSGQAASLERAAHRRGLTVGQLIRCLIRECLASEDQEGKFQERECQAEWPEKGKGFRPW